MVFDLVKTILFGVGARFVLLDAAMPATAIFYPPILFIVIIVLAVVIDLIVILVSRNRRRKQKKIEGDRPEGPENK